METFDNGEYYTATVFLIDSLVLADFVKTNHFETIKEIPTLVSGSQLRMVNPYSGNPKNIFVNRGVKGKNSWVYIANLNAHILWAEVQYPDWAGN